MEIKHDRSYLNLWAEQREAGFTQEIANKIVFDADIKDNRSIKSFQAIKDWLEDNFKMYQYKKDNGVKHGEHELFYWASWDTPERHWTIDFNEKLSFSKRIELLEKIIQYITETYLDIGGFVRLHYKNCMDWNLVNEYISNLEVNYNILPYDKLRAIFYFQFNDWRNLTKENSEKLYNIQNDLLKMYEDKKVIFNGIKGTLKKVDNYGTYGVFKPRATRQYYKIGLSNIVSLVAA